MPVASGSESSTGARAIIRAWAQLFMATTFIDLAIHPAPLMAAESAECCADMRRLTTSPRL